MKVSILINNYNYERYLGTAIESALNQTYSPVEVIIVDDGSTDGSHQVIERYADQIISILKPNGGQASAFNAGFLMSEGELICLLDADDTFCEHKVERIVEIAKTAPQSDWFFHPLDLINPLGDELSSRSFDELNPNEICDSRPYLLKGKFAKHFPIPLPPTSGLSFRRNLLKQILPMPESIKITSDNYVKYLALSTSPGSIIYESLGHQLIHNANHYSGKSNNHKGIAEVEMLTAHYLKIKRPNIAKFANNIFSVGVSHWWETSERDYELEKLRSKYFVSLTPQERAYIKAKAAYYYLKRRLWK